MPKVNALRVRLMDMIAAAANSQESPPAQTVVHLHTLGFLTHLDGYQQLCVGIPLFAQNPGIRLTKELYPAIASQTGSPDGRTVEHSIRKAIAAAWARKDPAVWAKYFPPNSDGAIPCPTNKEFICRMAELLKL